ncbi:MAG: hypothetical protein V3S98_06265 [Dehalococcoidia bacterium]
MTHSYGSSRPKTGQNHDALSRSAGYQKTMTACENQTRSPAKGSDLDRKERPKGDHSGNDNLQGYGDGGGGGSY